jgi:RNA polymerase sigma-70 factor (ECF subfamily)
MPQTRSADDDASCDSESGLHPLEAAAAQAAANPADKAALAELFAGLWEPVVRYMTARLNDPAKAEDLAQDVFVKIVQRISGYTGGGIFAWVWAIARNTCNDHFRRMCNRGYEQPTADFWHLDAPSSDMSPEEASEWSDLRRAINGKLAKLPSQQHEVLRLRISYGFSTTETAEIMGKPVGTIRVLQYRALAKLRTLMPEGDSSLAMSLLSSKEQQEQAVIDGPPLTLREKHDVGPTR